MAVLPEIVRNLDGILIRSTNPKGDVTTRMLLTSLVLRYSSSDVLRCLIDEVCSDDVLMLKCAKLSERHPLGFDKLVVFSSSYYDIRIHVWWPDEPRQREDIHNHRFSFASAVITGTIEVSSYQLRGGGVAMTRLKEGRTDQNVYQYKVLGDASVWNMSALMLAKGSSYYMDGTVLHRVDVMSNSLVATLFIRGPQERDITTILTERTSYGSPKAGRRESYKPEEARRRLQALAEFIKED